MVIGEYWIFQSKGWNDPPIWIDGLDIDTVSRKKQLDKAYTKMLRVVKNVAWRQPITIEVLYARLTWISTTIRERRLRFSGHCWRSKNEVISDLVLWEPKHGKRSLGGQARPFVDLLEADTGFPRVYLPAVTGLAGERSHGGRLRST